MQFNMSTEANQNNPSTHESSPVPVESISSDRASVASENKASENKAHNKKLTSNVWFDFNREVHPDSSVTATCTHCKRKFDAGSSKRISYLSNHLKSCKRKVASGGDIR